MCKICEGQEPLPELYAGYTPGPLWFGVKGLTEMERRWHNDRNGLTSDNPSSPLEEWESENLNREIQEMTKLNANVFAQGSEESTYYRFKFCPECGRKLIEE